MDEPSRERVKVPSTLGGLVYLIVVAICGVALVVVAFGPWRTGVGLTGVGLLVAAGMRGVLREIDLGMLRVRRNRWVDVVMLAVVGITLVVLAATIPDQPAP